MSNVTDPARVEALQDAIKRLCNAVAVTESRGTMADESREEAIKSELLALALQGKTPAADAEPPVVVDARWGAMLPPAWGAAPAEKQEGAGTPAADAEPVCSECDGRGFFYSEWAEGGRRPCSECAREKCAAPAEKQEPLTDEAELRRMLCAHYSGAMAYMDDGEAQDNREQPLIDFRRDLIVEIKRKMAVRAANAAWAKAQEGASTPAKPVLWVNTGELETCRMVSGAKERDPTRLTPLFRRASSPATPPASAEVGITDEQIETLGDRFGFGAPMEEGCFIWFNGNPSEMIRAAIHLATAKKEQ